VHSKYELQVKQAPLSKESHQSSFPIFSSGSLKVKRVPNGADARELLKVILERSSAETVVVSSGQKSA
jgi:hypothetical protein